MCARHAGMADAGEDAEIVAVCAELFQIRSERVVAAGFFRKEKLRHNAHVGFDGNHAARDFVVAGGTHETGCHGFKQGQADRRAGSAQKSAAGTMFERRAL